MFRITAIAFLLAINFDLFMGGKYSYATRKLVTTIAQSFR